MLSNYFPEWFRCGWSWPPRLNPCSYFLWSFLENTGQKNNPHTVKEQEQEISAAVISVSEETLAAVV
jgi:hypothetical protein